MNTIKCYLNYKYCCILTLIFLAAEQNGIIAPVSEHAKDYLSKVAYSNCTVMFPSVSVQFIGFIGITGSAKSI